MLQFPSSSLKYSIVQYGWHHPPRHGKRPLPERIGGSGLQPDVENAGRTSHYSKHCRCRITKRHSEQIFRLPLIPVVLSDISELSAVSSIVSGSAAANMLTNRPHQYDVMEKIYETADLLAVARSCLHSGDWGHKKLLPQMPETATFDSAFHQSMPKEACMYAPARSNNIKKYFASADMASTALPIITFSQKAAGISGQKRPFHYLPSRQRRFSVTAVKNGKSIDTLNGVRRRSLAFLWVRAAATLIRSFRCISWKT